MSQKKLAREVLRELQTICLLQQQESPEGHCCPGCSLEHVCMSSGTSIKDTIERGELL